MYCTKCLIINLHLNKYSTFVYLILICFIFVIHFKKESFSVLVNTTGGIDRLPIDSYTINLWW